MSQTADENHNEVNQFEVKQIKVNQIEVNQNEVNPLNCASRKHLLILKEYAEAYESKAQRKLQILKDMYTLQKESSNWQAKTASEIATALLGAVHKLVDYYKQNISATLVDKNLEMMATILERLQFDPEHMQIGLISRIFKTFDTATAEYESDLQNNIKNFINFLEMELNIAVRNFGTTVGIIFFEKICKAIKSMNNFKAINLIIDFRRINFQNQQGRTLLHYAVYMENLEIVEYLLKIDADVTLVTQKGNTILHMAALCGNMDIMEILLEHQNCNELINKKTTVAGTTALHIAAGKGFYDMVRLLLLHGAVYNAENEEGLTPIELSKYARITDLLELIDIFFDDIKNGNGEIIYKLGEIDRKDFAILTNVLNQEHKTLLESALAIANERQILACNLLELFAEGMRLRK